MKTKTAWYTFEMKKKITCTSSDEKVDGKTIWRDKDGKSYELKYARLARVWAFTRLSYKYDEEV